MEVNSFEAPEYIFNSINYVSYLVEYVGELNGTITNNPGIYIIVINNEYASVYIKSSLINSFENTTEIIDLINRFYASDNFEIVYVLPPEIYTLQSISAIEATQVNTLQAESPLNLRGKGVVVGIIDTGIDYLSDEFKDINGKTRINEIWDQSIGSNIANNNIALGTVYKKDQINEAIETYNKGGNPYDIVPSRDEIGHGTNMAGIVGALGKNPMLKGI
uniref:S8 family serine peptidase n=1 Tax=Clostridium tertium TaxID=1559 RepID=UPI0033322595